ncbi:U3 small nucleolar RNA-associated protein NOL7 [Brachyhypopomus gauderio]|uniref:U3 small nucleolar RNA-associated protein NOL7 n=1 Tax=Brachyhypopomus gauderio TaxID=698409 RepID=UPI004042A6F6
MAIPQRGISHSRPEKLVSGEMSGSSEDEGPEEVAFGESKTVALKDMKDALDSVKRGKELLKEKRRKRQMFFLKQKEKRLPQTLLEEFETLPEKQLKPSDDTDEDKEEKTEMKKSVKVKSLQGNSSVTRLKDGVPTPSLQQSAKDFVHARLYGPGTQRTTNAEVLSLEKKRGVNQGAAVQFVNKTWGAEQKAKAEKSNKKFVRKMKLIPS